MPFSRGDKMLPKTYMDGVPVKISEQYKPPRRVTLPLGCQHCVPGPSLEEMYDFTLEKNVLKKMTEWRKARRDETDRRIQRLKNNSQVCGKAEPLNELNLAKETSNPLPNAVSILMDPLPPDILTPTSFTSTPHPAAISNPSTINISDFEPDNSSPFDNMELKTINDMEILASVLSSNHVKASTPTNNTSDKSGSIKMSIWGPNNGYHHTAHHFPHLSNRQGLYNNHFDLYPLNANYTQFNFPSQTSSDLSTHYQPSHQLPDRTRIIKDKSSGTKVLDRKNSKSVPDIVEELEHELKEKKLLEEMLRKTKTPPPLPVVRQTNEMCEATKVVSTGNLQPLPDPTECLSSSMLNLARHISEMGFPLARVSRACQHFADDKKVIEYLLQVQRMEEKKFPSDVVERTLLGRSMEDEELVKFLEAFVVLLDLGFEEEPIRNALGRSNCDRDQALELLIS